MTPTYSFIADLAAQIPDIPSDSIISRTVYSDEAVKAVLFGFAAGQELSEHTASSPALLHILRGEVPSNIDNPGTPLQLLSALLGAITGPSLLD